MDINSYRANSRIAIDTVRFIQRNQTPSFPVTATSDADARRGGQKKRRAQRNEIWKPVPNTRTRGEGLDEFRICGIRKPTSSTAERRTRTTTTTRTRSASAVDVCSPRATGLKGYGWACRSSRINSPFPGPEPLSLFDEIRGRRCILRFHPSEFQQESGTEFESSSFRSPPRK